MSVYQNVSWVWVSAIEPVDKNLMTVSSTDLIHDVQTVNFVPVQFQFIVYFKPVDIRHDQHVLRNQVSMYVGDTYFYS